MKRSVKSTAAQLTDPEDELPEGATRFERAHHYGSRRHSAKWLQANRAAIDAAYLCDFDHTTPEGKELLSLVTLRVLDVAKYGETRQV